MPVIFTKQPPERTKELRKAFKHNNVSERFLRTLYERGFLDRIRHRINLGKIMQGKIPKGFDVHHVVPLSGGGTNSLHNLCLIEQSFHRFINKHCFDPALQHIQVGETVEINVPDLPPVTLSSDFDKFIQETLHKKNGRSGWRRLLTTPVRKLPSFMNWRK